MAEITDAVVVGEDELIESTRSRNIEGSVVAQPGDHWSTPINEQHPDLATLFSGRSREVIKFLADAGPKTMQRALQDAGFEARHRGGMRFSIRKPGGEWYVQDPSGWRNLDPREMVKDVMDVVPAWGSTGTGMVVGGIGGAAVGNVPGAIVGAGSGAATMELGKQALAETLGFSPDSDEVAGKVEVKWLRRTAPKGALESRTFQKLPDFDPDVFAKAVRDLEGKSIGEAVKFLRDAGWKGDLSGYNTIEDLAKALYWKRRANIKGTGMDFDPRSYDLYGAATGETPAGRPYAGSLIDLEKTPGEVRTGEAWRQFGIPETVEVRIGGRTVPLGRAQFGPAGRERLLRAADELRRGTKRAVGGALEKTGAALEFPSRAVKRGIEALGERVPRGVGERAALKSQRDRAIETLRALGEELIKYRQHDELLGEAGFEAVKMLGRRNLRTAEIEKVRQSLVAALKQAEKRGELPEYLTRMIDLGKKDYGLPRTPEAFRPFGVSPTYAPEAAIAAQATGIGAGIPGTGVLATTGVAGLVGKGIRRIGLEIMRDGTGRRLLAYVEKASRAGNQKVAAALSIPIRALQTRGHSAYKASVFTMMHDPDVRAFLRSEIGEADEE